MTAGTPNEEGLAATNDQPSKDTTNTAIVAPAGAECKEVARLRAEAALAGCGLYPLAGGGFLLTKWNVFREVPDLRGVAGLLVRMTGGAR